MNPTRLVQKQYPFLLQKMEKQPEFLDLVGTLPSDECKFLCVIGARRYSSYGEEVCKKLISGLRNYPVVIVSGLAIGIDSLAHECALEAGLKTIAFPGSGLSISSLYPRMHLELAKKIVSSGGALLSPFEREQRGTKWTFPIRNELMAGASHATLIIEARKGSGTMLTANAAIGMNRDVLVVPGSIFSDLSFGPHTLWSDGAIPVTSSGEILKALGFENNSNEDQERVMNLSLFSMSTEEKKIVDYLKTEPRSSSFLIEKTGFKASSLNVLISQLELRGIVNERGGRYHLGRP